MAGTTTPFRAVRHSRVLRRADFLWNAVRPLYHWWLDVAYRRRGLTLALGAGETMRADAACRDFVWVGDEFWREFLAAVRPGDRVADVGAHIGAYTVAAARRGANVDSYEAQPDIARLLRRSVELNGVADRVTVHETAVSSRAGTVRLAPGRLASGGGTVQLSEGIEVPAVVLDRPLDVLKIDVEGHELEVLRGARELLADRSRRPRLVLVEAHLNHGVDGAALEQALPGYALERVAARGATEHWVARAT